MYSFDTYTISLTCNETFSTKKNGVDSDPWFSKKPGDDEDVRLQSEGMAAKAVPVGGDQRRDNRSELSVEEENVIVSTIKERLDRENASRRNKGLREIGFTSRHKQSISDSKLRKEIAFYEEKIGTRETENFV